MAIRQARIDINVVAIVAGFISRLTRLQVAALDAVTAARRRAIITASVLIDHGTVVAGFNALGDDSVTAAQRFAGVATRIVIHLVAIIASFVSRLIVLQVLAPNPIAAARIEATTGTGVGLYPIAVVAVLTGIDAPVTTDLAAALIIASITDLRIAVITGFSCIYPAVSADLNLAASIAAIGGF